MCVVWAIVSHKPHESQVASNILPMKWLNTPILKLNLLCGLTQLSMGAVFLSHGGDCLVGELRIGSVSCGFGRLPIDPYSLLRSPPHRRGGHPGPHLG